MIKTSSHLSHHLLKSRRTTTRRSPISSVATATAPRSPTHRISIRHTARLINRRRAANLILRGRINAQRNPRQHTVGDVLRIHEHVLDEGIHVRGFFAEDAVVGVGGEILGVGVVRGGGGDLGEEVLVEEDLPDVRGGGGAVGGEERAVGAD